MLNRKRAVPILAAAVLSCWAASAHAQQQDDAADTARLIEVLELREGGTVADIGAGLGELTVRMARHVGPRGHVYSTDINPQRLQDIRNAVGKADLQNVTVIEGGSARTNIPSECCDAVFMRHVYHHIGDPPAMNADLRQSLKTGGRIAIVDFTLDDGVSAPAGRRASDASHGVTPGTVIEELTAAGFIGVQQLVWSSRGSFLVVGRRPN